MYTRWIKVVDKTRLEEKERRHNKQPGLFSIQPVTKEPGYYLVGLSSPLFSYFPSFCFEKPQPRFSPQASLRHHQQKSKLSNNKILCSKIGAKERHIHAEGQKRRLEKTLVDMKDETKTKNVLWLDDVTGWGGEKHTHKHKQQLQIKIHKHTGTM